jgi:hypothetical protein
VLFSFCFCEQIAVITIKHNSVIKLQHLNLIVKGTDNGQSFAPQVWQFVISGSSIPSEAMAALAPVMLFQFLKGSVICVWR